MKQQVLGQSTANRTEYVVVRDVNGNPITGLVYNSSGLIAYYVLPLAASASITLATQTVTGAWSSGGFVEVDSTHAPGLYRFDIPNAAFASSNDKSIVVLSGYSGMAALYLEYQIVAYNPNDSVRLGLTALPNAAAASAGGLPTVGTGASQIDVDSSGRVNVGKWLGTAVTAATAGVPDVNAARVNNVSASSVTTINANVGTTQPINFTGTAGSALVKSDMVDVAGAAVSTTTAQLGVNVVNFGGTAQTGRDIGASVLLSSGTGTGQLDFTSGVVKANLAQILGTALTETAGQIAGAFKNFFNVSAPTLTCLNINQTGDSYARIGAAGAGLTALGDTRIAHLDADVSSRLATTGYTAPDNTDITTLVTRLTSTRASNLDNLDAAVSSRSTYAGGAVASVTASVTVGTNNDKTGYALTSGEHTNIAGDAQTGLTAQGYTTARAGYIDTLNGLVAAIWSAGTRTLTSFSTLVSDTAAAVWAAATRTLTAFSFTVNTTDAGAIAALPTANQNADALLKRDWAAVTGEAADSLLNALRGLGTRNKVTVDYAGNLITVYKEDGTTVAYTIALTTQTGVTKTIVGVAP